MSEKERKLMSQRIKDALEPMKGTSKLGNKTSLAEAQAKGAAGNAATENIKKGRGSARPFTLKNLHSDQIALNRRGSFWLDHFNSNDLAGMADGAAHEVDDRLCIVAARAS